MESTQASSMFPVDGSSKVALENQNKNSTKNVDERDDNPFEKKKER